MSKQTKEQIMFVIWAQSVVATLGSLFFSEVMRFTPCELCWYQRILMYPLVIIYGVSLVKKDWNMSLPGLILSGIGVFVSLYHYLIQKTNLFPNAGDSCGLVPCTTEYVNYFGFITIPLMALTAFIIIFTLHMLLLFQQRRRMK
ncbi:disulfide oxidoreductase [Aquibacillus sediminis]|uniref:disulfide oxidoreductase n=1 Tax=Aquibacillus sediminis TaxID=2574734 RepID=UPI001109B001|nr:disulfide oxidoreductase [Aquibacillus sediminis]